MESENSPITELFERTEAYTKTSYQLTKLKAVEVATTVVSTLLAKAIVALVVMLMLMVLSIGIAFWLGECIGTVYYGFFAVAAAYVIMGVVLNAFLLRWIRKPISDLLIKHMLS
ncbi:MAG: hypothetical protein ACKVOR_02460 [Flavobacteriales bacterium]